ncbi:hypothetical protein CH254_22280 [Rhodococcus sp. 06-412-2C]|nr:hypothetical protein CH254_22280 [Rhodococcus sp. 06-412-2C]OZC93847.1 hypothetical protein CH279_20360 [Rhodococcus sp. 06-412-2B]
MLGKLALPDLKVASPLVSVTATRVANDAGMVPPGTENVSLIAPSQGDICWILSWHGRIEDCKIQIVAIEFDPADFASRLAVLKRVALHSDRLGTVREGDRCRRNALSASVFAIAAAAPASSRSTLVLVTTSPVAQAFGVYRAMRGPPFRQR